MEQFIQYLYEYEDGERVRNLGFMKVENKMDKSEIHIFAKQLDEIKGILFQREDGSKYIAAWENCEEDMPISKPDEPPCEEHPDVETPPQDSPVENEEEEITEYTPPITRKCEKIQRQDLSRLPRREWRLANNSFLLHGFYNYHYLMYMEEDDKIWIGVPGIYHEKEKVAANAFGFPEFIRPTDLDLNLSEEEQNTYEDFGYWCRQIER